MAENLEARVEAITDTSPQKQTKEYVPASGYASQVDEDADGYLEDALWMSNAIVQENDLQKLLDREMKQNMIDLQETIASYIDITTIPTDRYKKLTKNIIDEFLSTSWVFIKDYASKLIKSPNPNVDYRQIGKKFIALVTQSIDTHVQKLTWVERQMLKTITKSYPDAKKKISRHIDHIVWEISWMVQWTVLGVLPDDKRVKPILNTDRIDRKPEIKPIIDTIL